MTTWKILNYVLSEDRNFIESVIWQFGTLTGPITLTHPEGDSITPFKEITEDMVIEWVKEALGTEAVAKIENTPILSPQNNLIIPAAIADNVPTEEKERLEKDIILTKPPETPLPTIQKETPTE